MSESDPRVAPIITNEVGDWGKPGRNVGELLRAAAVPYSMLTKVASSGMVASDSTVVMNVPCAMVLASPWYW